MTTTMMMMMASGKEAHLFQMGHQNFCQSSVSSYSSYYYSPRNDVCAFLLQEGGRS